MTLKWIMTIGCMSTLLSCGSAFSDDHEVSGREVRTINREWKFHLGDVACAEKKEFNDQAWDHIGLPHSFSLPYFLGPRFPVDYGWYRKWIEIAPSAHPKSYFLEFDGVFQVAEVFVNGQRMGGHRGGYTGFSVDVTSALKPGRNLIAIRVNNLWDPQLAPRAGEHVFSGGIYRDVRLVITGPLHVTWYGTFVTTPDVNAASGTVRVQTEVANDKPAETMAVIRTRILDADGIEQARMESPVSVPPKGIAMSDQTSPPIRNPHLWHPDHPYLYSVETTILREGKAIDQYTSPLGFRWFEWTADRGFFLNGEHYYLLGANVHQDQAGWGDAASQSSAARDVQWVKDAGFNFIRGSHYPHSPAFSSACDRIGVCLWSESVFWGIGGSKGDGFWDASAYPVREEDRAGFEQSVLDQTHEMIRIHRNHPSIIAWSTGNETFFSRPEDLPRVRDLLKRTTALMRELDPTRPSAHGGVQRGELDRLDGSIAGYNGDGARLFINPGVPNMVTEYGSTISVRPGDYKPGFGELAAGTPSEPLPPYPWRYSWRSGEAIWCAFDHGSIASIPFGSMGIIDYFRLPKRSWFWYRNAYRNIPPPEWPSKNPAAQLRLTADRTILHGTEALEDAHLIVTVLDAEGRPVDQSPDVTLSIASGPGEFPTGPAITFSKDSDIAIREGQAAITFRSYYGGRSIIQAESPGLKSAEIAIETLGDPSYIEGQSIKAKARPYARYTGPSDRTPSARRPMNVSTDRPTRVSSEDAQHPSRLGNDGDSDTFWRPARDATSAWWQVDMENLHAISKVSLSFQDACSVPFEIQSSADGEHWQTVIKEPQSKGISSYTIADVPGSGIRFIRVVFPELIDQHFTGLSEVEIQAK